MTVGLLIGSEKNSKCGRMEKFLHQTERCKIVVIPANAGIQDRVIILRF